uniref:Peptidase M1 membrane alanine aminopeptidase domain-containing protein n=1 Tax=Knipowitschia caucasica TaxID=637954 RepID=A0AAV2MEL3_KNICA
MAENTVVIDPKTPVLVAPVGSLVVDTNSPHQWFGNLVTMVWWTHLWAERGLCVVDRDLCVDHCFPSTTSGPICVRGLHPGADLGRFGHSHPNEVNVGAPSEVDESFDAIPRTAKERP